MMSAKAFMLCSLLLSSCTHGFRVNIKASPQVTLKRSLLMDITVNTPVWKKNGFVAILSALSIFSKPLHSHALPSGGRMGGSSSFHSSGASSSSRSSSSSSRSSTSRSSSSSSRSYSSSTPSRSSSSSTPSRSSSSSTPSRSSSSSTPSRSSSSSTPSRSSSSSTPSRSSSSSTPSQRYSSSTPSRSSSSSTPSRSSSSSTPSQRYSSSTPSQSCPSCSPPPHIYSASPNVNVIVPVPVPREPSPSVVIISPRVTEASPTEEDEVITREDMEQRLITTLHFEFVLIAGSVFFVYNALSNIVGGRDFSKDSCIGGVDGASVIRLTIGLDADWGNDRNIMLQLSNLAEKYNEMADRSDFANLLSETSLALLRTRDDWTASSYSGEQFNDRSIQNAESSFQQLAIKERAKFDEENSNPDSNDTRLNLIKPSNRFDGQMPLPTQAVVSIVVALRGKSEAANMKSIRSSSDVIACLERLAADALTDEGENIMALEVLWSPSSRGMRYTEKDLIMDYPDLIKL